MNETNLEDMEFEIEDIIQRERDYAPWMAQVMVSISKDPGYNKLNWRVREEIETIVAAVE